VDYTVLESQIRELSPAGPMVGSPQGVMRTRRLLIGPALLLPGRAGFQPLRASRVRLSRRVPRNDPSNLTEPRSGRSYAND
jgi:hypothetical protein